MVERHQPEQVCGGLGGGGRTFARPKEGGKIIRFAAKGVFAQIKTLRCNLVLQEGPGKFKVRVGKQTRVVGSSKLTLNVGRKGEAPKHRRG